jgi:hypothetical protein
VGFTKHFFRIVIKNALSENVMKKILTKFVFYFYENFNENIYLVNTHSDLFFSANFGGTVGLCIGFSLLSVAEIVYFFSMRPYNDLGPML